MGCDIHVYTERKNRDGKWECADFFEVNEYYDKDDNDEWEQPMNHVDFYKGRDYELFGALAGVRSDIEHIEPKGIPDDCSKECKEDFIRWDSDAHTPSWMTITELKDHQKKLGNTVKRSGMISEKQKEELALGIKPSSWCQWTSIGGYVEAEWEDESRPLDDFMGQLDNFMKTKYYEHEIKVIDDNDFRVVFWFDN